VREGWSGKETLSQTKKMGFDLNPNLEKFVKEYVDARKA
jgi:hypothetical protein